MTKQRMKAELRSRGEGRDRLWVGVFWPVDENDNPVGDKQIEIDFGGPGELGPRMSFNLYVKELVKQPGFSLVETPVEVTKEEGEKHE
jgi:hypothetical protein